MTTRRKFVYKKLNADSIRVRKDSTNSQRDFVLKNHVSIFKPVNGVNTIRILPPSWEDADHYGLDIYVHYGIGVHNSEYLDLSKMGMGADPIAEEVKRARSTGDPKDIEYSKALDSTKRVVVYLVDRDRPAEGVKMWAMPQTVDREIARQIWNNRTREVLPIDDPDEGFDLVITRTQTAKKTDYTVVVDRHSSRLELTDEILRILEEHPLPTVLNYKTYDYIKEQFDGGGFNSYQSDRNDREAEPAQHQQESHGRGGHQSSAPQQPPRSYAKEPELKQSESEVFTNQDLNWEFIHELRGDRLDAFVEFLEKRGEYEPPENASFEDDGALIKDICEVLGLQPAVTKQPVSRRATRDIAPVESAPVVESTPVAEAPETDSKPSYSQRLAAMRNKQNSA